MTLIQQIVFAPYEFIQKKDFFDYISLVGGFVNPIIGLFLGIWLANINLKRKENRRLHFIRENFTVLLSTFVSDTRILLSKQKDHYNYLNKTPIHPKFISTENPHYIIFKSYDITELKSAWSRISKSNAILNTIIEIEKIKLRIESINYNNEVIVNNNYKETKMNLSLYKHDFDKMFEDWPEKFELEKHELKKNMNMFHLHNKKKEFYSIEVELHKYVYKFIKELELRTHDEYFSRLIVVSADFLNTMNNFKTILSENIEANAINILEIEDSLLQIERNHKLSSKPKVTKRCYFNKIANACKNLWKCRYRCGSKHDNH